MATIRYTELNFPNSVLPALLLPHTTKPDDKIELLKGQLYNYWYRFGQAGYKESRSPRHPMTFILERLSLEVKEHDPAIFNVRT